MASVVIIGGGPAGSSAGIHLARAGWRVTIVEARAFPRMKVCGEFISPAATRLLEDLLPPGELLAAGARRVGEFVLEVGEREASWPMPCGAGGRAWVLSRGALDSLLLSAARDAGAAVIQPCPVRGVDYSSDGVEVRLDAGHRIAADIAVHADGHGRFDAPDQRGRARATPARPDMIAFKCHLRPPAGRAVQGIRMRSAAGAYIGTVQVEGRLATIALVVRRALVARHAGDADAMLRALWPAFDPAWRVSPWRSCGVAASGFIQPGHPRSFRLGNAAGAVEPVGGEGIGLALWSGATLARVLTPADLCSGEPIGALRRAQRDFAAEYARRLRLRGPACRIVAAALQRPGLVRALWPLLACRPGRALVFAPWYFLTGKPMPAD